MNTAVLLSGGTGTRVGADIPKQYIRVGDKKIYEYSLQVLQDYPGIDSIYIVAEEGWRDMIREELEGIDKFAGFVLPGSNRQRSIKNALIAVKNDGSSDTILFHDAARPSVKSELLDRMYEALEEYDGVMPALPVSDTLYECGDGSFISGNLDRSIIYAGQAPELFRFDSYYEANMALSEEELDRINGSSEPAILAGLKVKIVAGDQGNYKITTKNDLERFRGNIN